ncbi:ROK family transcriptional regulator [Microlunatus soli]|uniref:Sugar kinase of the NBD/HSP70 family, may contain an N-terminal HTH domain n=1 Tax=Microlunatus soli TaxID=630515 RepID=A0A1H1NK75_9ACTN|nr:ROK family transcriptional regulator [Microlunatus soli]SDR99260.1 Sugar kinase of the NBD/HSP70 family, may contain an N-terminal HTH domain [Microlunatus soli]
MKALRGATALETHSAILDLIRTSGEVSRIELAARSGLTEASISRIVKQLLVEGLVIESGVGDFTGGKRRTLIQLNAGARHAVGISLDDAGITYMITDLGGAVVGRQHSAGIATTSPATVTKRVAQELQDFLVRSGVDRTTLVGIGIALAGRQDESHDVLRSNPQATEWEMFAVEDALGAATGLPVVIDNDSTCAAIGEYWTGRSPASEDFATLYLATGFGLGLVIDGDAYRGASSNVGEIGHLVLDVHGPPCWCGNNGCLEALAAPLRIVDLARQEPTTDDRLGLSGSRSNLRRDFATITEAAAAGDADCVELIEQSAFYVAMALVSVTNLLDLDRIILAGPGFNSAADIYLRVVTERLDRHSFARAVHPTTVSLSKAGQDSAALGAASMVLHSRMTPHQTSRPLAVVRAPGTAPSA